MFVCFLVGWWLNYLLPNTVYFHRGKMLASFFMRYSFLSIFEVRAISHPRRSMQRNKTSDVYFLDIRFIYNGGQSICSTYCTLLYKNSKAWKNLDDVKVSIVCMLFQTLDILTWQWPISNFNYRIKLLVKHVV